MNFQIELTNRCNLQCVECPNRLMNRKREDMAKDVFEVILKEYIVPHNAGTVILHKDGEPLLHPHLKEIITQISEVSNAKIDIYTNGLLLKKPFVEFLTSISNKVWLLISFHFHSYEGKLYTYSNVAKELEDILGMTYKNVELVFATHVTDYADNWMLNRWKVYWDNYVGDDQMLKAVHINTAVNPWAGLIKQKNNISFDACPYADGQHYFIGVTGNVIPCCMDLEEEVVFGNVLTDSRGKIEADRDTFYETLNAGRINEDLCKRCLNV